MDIYGLAKEKYSDLGVDVDERLNQLESIALSIHCWQGDDVVGFESPDAKLEGGGIIATGNYPGRARTLNEASMKVIIDLQ
jgi:L-rhamnose isomerase